MTLSKALHEKWAYTLFSVQPLCALCLCGSLLLRKNNHRDTEHTEVAQRLFVQKPPLKSFQRLPKRDLSLVFNLDCPVHRKRLEHFAVERLKRPKLLVPRLGSFQPGTRRAKKRGPIVAPRLSIAPLVNLTLPKQRLDRHSMPHLPYATVRTLQCGQPGSAHVCKGLIR